MPTNGALFWDEIDTELDVDGECHMNVECLEWEVAIKEGKLKCISCFSDKFS